MLCMVVVLILNLDYKVPIIRHRFASKISLFFSRGFAVNAIVPR